MKKSSKKTLLKQGIAVLLAFSLIFMMQGVMNLSVEAGTEPDEEIESVVNKKYLAENDFENAKLGTYINAWDYPKTSRDAFIYSETETNKVLKYVQNRFGVGVVNLGMAYTADDVNEYLRVEAGKTYVINFEYRVEGTPTDDMVIGVAVGKPDLASAITAYDGTEVAQDGCNQSNYRKYFTSYYEDKNVDYKKDTTYNTEWINETYTFTVPDKCDLSVNNALQLYVVNGKKANVYLDNIKVYTTNVSTTKTLFETDYETAYHYELSANKTESVWEYTQNFSGDLRPGYLAEEENTVLYYRHSNYGLGIVVLGHDYAGNENQDDAAAENAITVEPGVTYKVTFDYKIKGSIGNSDLNIGLAIGKSHFGFASGSPNGGTAIKDNSEYVSQYTTELTFGKNTTPNQEWQTKEAYITVPQDADLTTFNTLLLYAKYGNQTVVEDEEGVTVDYSGVLLDNIEVTQILGETDVYPVDIDVTSNDYETAHRYELSANKTESVWTHTQNFSGDLRPGYLAEEENTVLYYRHSNYGLGIVVLGHDYAGSENQDDAAAENAITVEPGVTYKVTFDYKIKGSIGSSDLNIGLAIGKSHFGFASGLPNGGTAIKDNSEYVSQYTTELTFGKNTTPNQEWQTKEAYITVPQDADLTTFNTLLLYAKYGNQQVVKDEDGVTVDYSGVLFDNIKVTALAGVGVSYKTDDHVSNIYNSDGNISYNAMLDSIGNAIKWYTDETHTSAFISSDYVRTGVLDTVSLYGLKDTSLAAFIKGDADGDGIVENDDIHLMRKGILGTDVTYPSRTDIDDSGELDVRDLVRSKKAMNSENNANITIGGVELSNYKFETNGSFTSVVESRISAIESLGGGMSAENTNAISVALNTSLADNLYILKVDNGMVRIEGGSENAVAAALEAIIGYIKAGVSIDSADSMEFIYNGNAYTDYETLILNENF